LTELRQPSKGQQNREQRGGHWRRFDRHYLSDVAFGAALGIAAGRTLTIGRGNARFGLAPMASPGGGGVAFNWMGKQ
jgi:hypothetical protein